MKKICFIISVIFFSFSCGCIAPSEWMLIIGERIGVIQVEEKPPAPRAISENRLSEIDIHGIEVIYLPMFYNHEWEYGFHEFISVVPSETGKLILLERKNGHFPYHMDLLKMIYKRSEDKKELYFMSTCWRYGENNDCSVYFMIQIPSNVRIEFYEDLTGTHFFTKDDNERVKNNLALIGNQRWLKENRTKYVKYEGDLHGLFFEFVFDGWSICEEFPTKLTHLPGMESSRVFANKAGSKKIHTLEGHYNLNTPEITRRRELFYQSVKEHNMRILATEPQ